MRIGLKLADVVALFNGKTVTVDGSEVYIDERMDSFYSALAKALAVPEFFMGQLRDKLKKL